MSGKLAMDNISLISKDGFAHTEYSLDYHETLKNQFKTNNLDYAVDRFGKTHCIIGSKCDCRTMTFGTWEDVKAEMDATFELSKRCKGFIWAVGNHIPANVSDEICLKYLEYLRILRRK